MKIGAHLLAVGLSVSGASFAVATPANALSLDPTLCVSVRVSDGGCRFLDGNLGNQAQADAAQTLYDANRDPDIVKLNYLGSNTTGSEFGTMTFDDASTKLSGDWSTPGFTIDYLGVKAGNQFVLYYLGGVSSGDWSTVNLFNTTGGPNPKDVQLGLSHLAFFGSAAAVPEPATWAMMIVGFGAVGATIRRRSTKISFA